MTWIPNFQLGPAGGEIEFPCQAMSYSANEENVEMQDKNLLGATFKSFQRISVPTIQVAFARLPDSFMAILRGLTQALNPLNFIFNSSLGASNLQATSTDTTHITIPPMSASGVTITGVFLASDFTQVGTNYYSGGSFDPTGGGTGLGIIALGSALPGAQTDVTINYTYAGVSCYVKVTAKPHTGVYSGYWQGTLTITGA